MTGLGRKLSKPCANITELKTRKHVRNLLGSTFENQEANSFSLEEHSIRQIVFTQIQHKCW